MALLPILHYPDPRLSRIAMPVLAIDDSVRQLVADMAETMYAAPGIGLAATQVNVHRRIVVLDISETKDQLQVFINPKLTRAEGEVDSEEGCLSVPGIFETVQRQERVWVEALNLQGEPLAFEAEGLLAVCLQHEVDHLNGKVFVERLSRLKLNRIRAKIAKQARITA